MNRDRASNFELLRIVSMFFIVFWHCIVHGNLLSNTIGKYNFILEFLLFILIIHVNSFMLLTGYFMVYSKFKLEKVVKILFQLFFYNFVINTVLYFCGFVKYNNVDYLKSILFFNTESYWYIQCYLIVYCFSPLLNKIIEIYTKNQLKHIIILLLLFFSIIPLFLLGLFNNNNGMDVIHYSILYLIGAYIKKYDVSSYMFNKFNLLQKKVLYIFIFFVCIVINISLFYFCKYIKELDSNILFFIGNVLGSKIKIYSNIFVIIQSVVYFMFFTTLSIKSKFINYIGSLTLGVYFFHENMYLRTIIYKYAGIDKGIVLYGNSIILRTFLIAIIIFIIGLIIEAIRKFISFILLKIKPIRKLYNNIILGSNQLIETHYLDV